MINIVIKGINLVKPGKDIASLGKISIGRLGEGDGGGNTGSINAFESMGNVVGVAANETNFSSAIAAGVGGPKVTKPIELKAPTGTGINTMAGGLAGVGGFSGYGNIEINVNGGDPNAVVDALRTYMRQNGSVPIKISNAF